MSALARLALGELNTGSRRKPWTVNETNCTDSLSGFEASRLLPSQGLSAVLADQRVDGTQGWHVHCSKYASTSMLLKKSCALPHARTYLHKTVGVAVGVTFFLTTLNFPCPTKRKSHGCKASAARWSSAAAHECHKNADVLRAARSPRGWRKRRSQLVCHADAFPV